MKTKKLLPWRLALASALALLTHTTFAQTWQTVDDFQYVPGRQVWARSGAVDALGRLYVAGSGNDATPTGSGVGHGLIMRSADQGANWTLIEDYIHQDTNRFTYLQSSRRRTETTEMEGAGSAPSLPNRANAQVSARHLVAAIFLGENPRRAVTSQQSY